MGLSIYRVQRAYENALIDRRAFTQLAVVSFVGFLVGLGLYFFYDAGKLGIALWALVFLLLTVTCATMAMKSHKAAQTWKKVYDEAIEHDK